MVVPGGVDPSGTENVIPCLLALIERVARVHELHVFAQRQFPEPRSWELLGARVHNAGRRPIRARSLAQIVAEHRRAPFDLFHGVWSACGTVAGAAGLLLRRPVLTHLTGGDTAAVPEIAYGRCLTAAGRSSVRWSARLSDHVTAPSEFIRAQAAAHGVQAERLTYGVSLGDWPVRSPARREPGAEARLLYAANLNAVKDPWTIVRAARVLKDRGLRFRLDVLGLDTLDGAVQRLAAELGVMDVVHFQGWAPYSELRGWMERADLLLLASLHEGDPIVALEAALAGVPTVGTPVGHLVEWAPDAAAIAPFGDADGLADAAAALLADEDRRLAMAAAAQRHAVAHDADHAAARVLELYEALARKR